MIFMLNDTLSHKDKHFFKTYIYIPNVPIKRIHKMTKEQAVKEMQATGMKLERNITNLPWQHCMVFVKI